MSYKECKTYSGRTLVPKENFSSFFLGLGEGKTFCTVGLQWGSILQRKDDTTDKGILSKV